MPLSPEEIPPTFTCLVAQTISDASEPASRQTSKDNAKAVFIVKQTASQA
jgi:hypothetical protein